MIIFTYLLSRDLVETLERKFGFSIDVVLKEDVKELEQEFIDCFRRYVPENVRYNCVNAQDISNQIASILEYARFPVISLDRVYIPSAQEFLEVTRQTNQETGQVKIAERPGALSIEEQVEKIREYKEIVLADVGAFEGTTILDICDLLSQRDIKVDEIVLGISSNEANKKLNKTRKVSALNLFNFYEWIELRDLFGIDGRNIGIRNGKREFIPYWENLCKWASISTENRDEVERLCKKFNSELIGKLWQEGYDLNRIGRPVKYLGKK